MLQLSVHPGCAAADACETAEPAALAPSATDAAMIATMSGFT
jgi:hypothetical protein